MFPIVYRLCTARELVIAMALRRAMDFVVAAIWIGGVGAFSVLLIAGGAITWANRGSETVVLGFTALLGAFALFIGQLVFQLRGSTSEEAVGTQIIINKTAPSANALQPSNKIRADAERTAADWLGAQSLDVFADGGKVARDHWFRSES